MQSDSSCSSPCKKEPNENDKIYPPVANDGTDESLAREMYQLTAEEREKIYNDIHGVAQVQEETPEFLEQCLEMLKASLSTIPKRKRKEYDKAVFLRPSLETDINFKLSFLRTDQYDGKKAANRMVNFFKEKYVLFGEKKLVKRITINDLSEDELTILRSGCMMQLPLPDRSGRPVFFSNVSKFDFQRFPMECFVSERERFFVCRW